MAVTGSSWLDFVIGFVVSLLASIMNAAGLNLLKLDHVRNSSLSPERQRNECGRPMWHVGLYLYVASQLAGSTIALSKYFVPVRVSHKANFGRKEYQNGIYRSLEQVRDSVCGRLQIAMDGNAPGHPTPIYSCEQWQDEKKRARARSFSTIRDPSPFYPLSKIHPWD